MRILFLTRAYSQHAGGMERLSYEMIEAVKKQPGVSVSVIAHKGSLAPRMLGRAPAIFFNITALPKAFSLAKQADVIHLGDPMLSFLGWLLKLLTKKPVAVTVHGLDITYPNLFYQLYLKLFFTNFDKYLPISNDVKSILTKSYTLKANQALLLNPGISDRFYDPTISRDQLSKLLRQDVSGKKVLFTSGRLVKRKGHAWFIENVLPKLPQNVIYVIAGDGPEFRHLRGLATSPGVELDSSPGVGGGRFLLLGRITDEQLKILYNTVDALIMPNLPIKNDVEGFGLVLLEAALCQRPVFASHVDGIPDAIHDGKNGTLLPAQNPEAWVSDLQEFLANPKSNSVTRDYTLKNFNWKISSQRFLKAIQSLGHL